MLKALFLAIALLLPTQVLDLKPKPWNKTALFISQEFAVDYQQAERIADTIKILANPKFPKQSDLLAIISIESRFNHKAVSDKNAKGLMQIKYRRTISQEDNILAGVELLEAYSNELKSTEAAVHAYNLGIGNYKKGRRVPNYYSKYLKAKTKFKDHIND